MKKIFQLAGRDNGIHLPAYIAAIAAGFLLFFNVLSSQPQSKPDFNVTVAKFTPKGETDRATNITVEFTRDMMPDDSLNVAVLNPPLEIDPPLAGIARWVDNNTLRFYPEKKLQPATEYTVRVISSQAFLFGNRINEKREFTFYTSPLRVLRVNSYNLYDPEIPGQVKLNIDITFNYPVDPQALARKLSISGQKDANKSRLSFNIYGTEGENPENSEAQKPSEVLRVITEPFMLTDSRQKYAFKIEAGLTCPACGKVESSKYETTISVEEKRRLFVRELRAWYSGQQPIIQIPFSTQITSKDVKDFINIDPEIDFAAELQYNNINLRGNFEAGKTYEVTVAPGIMGRDGSILEEEFSSKVTIPDIPPTVRFLSAGMYLPRDGSRLLELETTNIDTLSVEVEQYYANNLVFAMATNAGSSNYYSPSPDILGRTFFEKSKGLDYQKNKPLTTTIDIGSIIGDSLSGIFKVSARNKERRWDYDSRMVMLTDIGIMARLSDDYLMVWVNSLKDVSPIKKAEVTLWSKNNQALLQGNTDSRGICIFDNISDKTAGFDPFLITVAKDDDLSFLEFNQCLLPTSDFDVKGRPYLTKGYEAFLYTDRGIYRPGDTLQITSIVRGAEGKLPEEFPYIITINDPAGREFKSFRVKTGGTSFLNQQMAIPDFARTGRYTAVAHIGEDLEIGRIEFQVEEFMPDRIKVTVSTERKSYNLGNRINIDVNSKFLFGTPAKGLKVSGEVIIDPMDFSSQKYSRYSFTDENKKFSRIYANLSDARLDDSGYHAYQYEIPQSLNPPSALKGLISASVSEEGGRTVSSFAEVTINPYPRYVGIHLDFEGYVKPGEPAKASLIALNPDGNETSIDSLQVKFYRLVYHSILKKDSDGNYRYVSESTPVLVDSAYVNLGNSGASVNFTPPEYGRYQILATDPAGGHSTSAAFYASGWGFSPWSMENPDRIEIDLDKDNYSYKEKANVQIRAPFGGKLLITIEKTNVLDFITYDMDSNTAEITLPIKKDYFPTAYITAAVIRKADEVEKTTPARAFGIAPIVINTNDKKLPVTITAPAEIKPRSTLAIQVETGKPGVSELTLAAVDAGILQLIDFQTPDPLAFFYGKRKLGLNPFDIYSFLYPDVEKAQSNLSPAGGMSFFGLREKAHINPIQARRVKPVSLWSGIVKTDETGKAVINFEVPEFNGKLVLMAVAVQNDQFGATSAETIVRDKIILQESFPRFVAPDDVIDGLVSVFNKTGKDTQIKVSLETDGPITLISPSTQALNLLNNAEGEVIFSFKAGVNPGKISFKIGATDGTESSMIEFEMPNRPPRPLTTEHGSGSVTQDSPVQFKLPNNWLETTASYIIQTSSLSAVEFTDNINFLVKYPYGCLEQTTSRLFPLLYFESLAKFISPELLGSGGPNYFIQEGIIKLNGLLRPDGSFSFWPNGEYFNNWASVYASHFMIEARKKGFQIDNDIYNSIIGNLKSLAHGRQTENVSDPARIYAAYALAQANEIDRKAVNYLKSLEVDSLPVFSRFQLAGALALAGDKETALTILPTDIQPSVAEPETGGNFSSGVRTNAIMLEVLTEIDPGNPSAATLANSLMKNARIGKWYTTQETAFALMALGKYLSGQAQPDFTGTVTADGKTFAIDTKDFKKIFYSLENNNVSISIEGTGTCFYYWQAGGIPLGGVPKEFANGIKISREYLNRDGKPIDLTNIPLGTQVICHIKAAAQNENLENVVISDLLPAGLEIENPRLKTTPALSWLPEKNSAVTFQDIRDDRMLLFMNLRTNAEFEYYYSLRAISAGNFTVPPIASECMYNPVIAGASSSGAMTVTNPE